MSDSYVGPNVRGTAERSTNKNHRLATHTPIIRSLVAELSPKLVIEHGMGKSSTPLFHELNIPHVISLEDSASWRVCDTCSSGRGTNKHTIMSYGDIGQDFWNTIDSTSTFLFLDGPDAQRQALFDLATRFKIAVIIEHDAESFSSDRVAYVKRLGAERGYVLRQYVKENPETGLFIHESQQVNIDFSDYVDF